MKAFPFSLDEAAKDWLYLQLVMFNTWEDMKRMLLEKFFLASKTTTIRKEICGIKQHSGETLHEYWERFNKFWHIRQSQNGESADIVNIACEASRCREASTKHIAHMWNMYLSGAPYRHVPHIAPDSNESVGAIGGGYQYGRQLYPNRPYDSQQFWRQPY
ncbi:hypothetical protein CR513_41127, partial [Mucuna pruriens]